MAVRVSLEPGQSRESLIERLRQIVDWRGPDPNQTGTVQPDLAAEVAQSDESKTNILAEAAAVARGNRTADDRPDLPYYAEARRQLQRHAWGHAQRALEEAARREPDSPAAADLIALRSVRRQIRHLATWPSDPDSHLALGRALFELEMGDDALREFVSAERLAPDRYEGFALATLEYLYRGQYAAAMEHWLQARDRNPELPDMQDLLASLPTK